MIAETSGAPRRGLLLFTALAALLAGAAIYVAALPALWHWAWPYAIVFGLLGIVQIGTALDVALRPDPRRVTYALIPALVVVVIWLVARVLRILPGPDPWVPMVSGLGFADVVCAGLQLLGVIGLLGALVAGRMRQPSTPWRTAAWIVFVPILVLVLSAGVLGVVTGPLGAVPSAVPMSEVAGRDLPPGRATTVEYCRPDGLPQLMDLYPPTGGPKDRPAPVAMYVHGGGVLDDRRLNGLGAPPLREELNARGFLVVSIDYRLPPAAPWPAQLEDAKCAVRFLRAHANRLSLDPDRIGAWGISGGGFLVSMLGATGPDDRGERFDRGGHAGHSSAVQAVVDISGPSDLTRGRDSDLIGRFLMGQWNKGSAEARQTMSPLPYVSSNTPPFLILHGRDDRTVPLRHARELAARLRGAGVPVRSIEVTDAGHSLDVEGQQPSTPSLTSTALAFFTSRLR